MSDIFLAVPTRGTINWNTVIRLLRAKDAHPEMPIHIEGGALSVSHVRHGIVKAFLATDKSWLVMLDDDVVPPRHFLRLIEHDRDIIAAAYPIMTQWVNIPFPAALSFNAEKNRYEPMRDVLKARGLVDCDAVGTGCIAIRRRVLEDPQMARPFEMTVDEWGRMHFSDDVNFCHRARALGYTIAMDFDIRCDHMPAMMSLQSLQNGYVDAYTRGRRREEAERMVML